ncbi:MAG: ankyrin repeat domain-containing protein [Candidatus Anstonellales archaeon]
MFKKIGSLIIRYSDVIEKTIYIEVSNKDMALFELDDIDLIKDNINNYIIDNKYVDHLNVYEYLLVKSYIANAHKFFDILIEVFGVDINTPIFRGLGYYGDDLTIFNICKNVDTTKEMADILEKHIVKFKYINNRDPRGNTPILIACMNSDIELVKVLLKAKPDLNILNIYKSSPLSYAVSSGNYYITRLLLDNGADPNLKIYCREIEDNVTHLAYYIINNMSSVNIDFDLVLLMIAYGAKIMDLSMLTFAIFSTGPALDAIALCIDYEEDLVGYLSGCYNRFIFKNIIRYVVFKDGYDKNIDINEVIKDINKEFTDDNEFYMAISAIMNSLIDHIDNINLRKLRRISKNRIKILKYKLGI